MSADGDGRDVRYGFCARAADRAGFEVDGVISVISRKLGQLDFSIDRLQDWAGMHKQTPCLSTGISRQKIWGEPSKLKRWSPARLGHS
jgi:hypothetical protein